MTTARPSAGCSGPGGAATRCSPRSRYPSPSTSLRTRFGVHPALLDAAMHAALIADAEPGEDGSGSGSAGGGASPVLPFVWNQVTLHAAGANRLRVRIDRSGGHRITFQVADSIGRPVLSVGSVVGRVVSREQLGSGVGAGWVWRVGWRAVRSGGPAAGLRVVGLEWAAPVVAVDADLLVLDLPPAVLDVDGVGGAVGVDVPARVREVCARVVEVAQAVLAGPDSVRLVVVTIGG